MRVGIFGDSYADWQHYPVPAMTKVDAWPLLLEQTYKHTVGNYSKGAVDLTFVYKEFLQHHKQYDKIVFIVPNLKRRVIYRTADFVPDDEMLERLDEFEFKGTIVNRGQNIGQSYIEKLQGKSWSKNYADWYWDRHTGIQDQFKVMWDNYGYATEQLNAYAIKQHVKSLRPSVVMLDSFNDTTKRSLVNITKLDTDHYDIWSEVPFKRWCHFSAKQNHEFAEYMHLALTQGFDIRATLNKDTIGKHYTLSPTLLESGLGEGLELPYKTEQEDK